jgi:hypothetical protein
MTRKTCCVFSELSWIVFVLCRNQVRALPIRLYDVAGGFLERGQVSAFYSCGIGVAAGSAENFRNHS